MTIGSEVASRSQSRSSQLSEGLACTPRKWPVAAPWILLRRLLQTGAEDRILEVVGDAHPVEEGQPGLLQVARLPAGDEGVDGEHDRAVARRLGALDEAARQLAVVRPVELEPARRVAARLGDLLEREVRVGAGDHRHAERRRRAGARQFALLVDDLLHADRGEQQRRRRRRADQLGREVALGDVAQHARHDLAPLEGRAVGAHRVLRARSGEDVVGGPLVHRLAGALLQLRDRDRDRGRLPTQPAQVDLPVVVGEGRHRGGGYSLIAALSPLWGVKATNMRLDRAWRKRGRPKAPSIVASSE